MQNQNTKACRRRFYHRVFTASGSGRRDIVKIPNPVVPANYITASDVSTLEYIRTELQFPLRKVLAGISSSDDAVGCEYIIMEEATGEPLQLTWSEVGPTQNSPVLRGLTALQKGLVQTSHNLGGYGSLYFCTNATTLGFQDKIQLNATALAQVHRTHTRSLGRVPQEYLTLSLTPQAFEFEVSQEGC
ncbi:MAG: Phosphotransferase enzyme [Candelina submexicana]|nr:MAG: Phosphotransferase enzyme [Candelina submexicana]